MKIMISACLAGDKCKYNGKSNKSDKLLELLSKNEFIKVCPEMLGGLGVPRKPCEIVDSVVRSEDGESFEREYRRGAQKALEIARDYKPDLMILQSRSPSCGVNEIYDGSFSGKKVRGMGIFARLAMEEGFKVVDIEDI